MPSDSALSNGPSNEEQLGYMREYQQQKRSCDEANGVLRSIVKRAKSAGVNTKAMIASVNALRRDPEEVTRDLRDQVHMMALRGMPIDGIDLFPANFDLTVAPQAVEAEDLWQAEESGYRAGKNAKPIEDNPYPDSSDRNAIWLDFWNRGQAQLARELGDGAMAAPASRKRPGRKGQAAEAPAVKAGSGRKRNTQAMRPPRRGRNGDAASLN